MGSGLRTSYVPWAVSGCEHICYAGRVHFGPWHLMADAINEAPDAPGVVQMRAEAIFACKKGRSAMVHYACSAPDQTLREFMSRCGPNLLCKAEEHGARWIRFAEATKPEQEPMRLLRRFEERFASRPVGNETIRDGKGAQ